jgi:selenophosphate synthetase-related protein
MDGEMTITDFKNYIQHATTHDLVCLRAELDRLQDTEDEKAGKHVNIPCTVALLAELMYKAECKAQERKIED